MIGRHIGAIAEECALYLRDDQPPELQDDARELYHELIRRDR